jgi:hypothetical protein
MPYPSVTNSLLSVSRYAPAVPPCAPVKKPGDIITRKGMTRAARAAGAVAALGALGAAVPANASLHATGSGAAPPAQLRASCPVTAYIADVYGGVTPINTATNTAGPAITVGTAANYGPGAIAITPNRKTAYVLDESAGGNPGNDSIVTPISTATGKAGRPIPVGTRPTPAPRKAPARPGIPPARPAPAPAGLRGTRPRLPKGAGTGAKGRRRCALTPGRAQTARQQETPGGNPPPDPGCPPGGAPPPPPPPPPPKGVAALPGIPGRASAVAHAELPAPRTETTPRELPGHCGTKPPAP